jgi:hypothetical protein
MTKSKWGLVAMSLICAAGCTQGTPGGPGVQTPVNPQTQSTNKPVIGEARDTFSLRTPMLATSVKQGESKSVSISIQRGTDFDDDVQLSFTEIPTGVTLDPANPTLAKGDKEAKFNITAGADAAIGDFTVKVTGHPTKGGPDAVNQFKLDVSAK